MITNIFKKIAVFSFTLLLIVVSGCKKWLDQAPITEVGPDVVFNDASGAYKALIGAYSRLVGDQMYGIRVSLYFPVDNDETQGPTGAGDNDRRDIARSAATSGNAQINSPFNQMFTGIEFANICIANIPNMASYAGSPQLQRMYGEALTLRALFYLEAIRNFGDLPEHFEPASALAISHPFPSRTDRDALYDHLLDDLLTAEAVVPWRNDVPSIGDVLDERITKGTVKGLRARIALYRGGYSLRSNGTMQRGSNFINYYQIAKDECNSIMTSGQHALNPSYRDLWKVQVGGHVVNDPQGELMWQASAIGLTGAEDTKLGYYNGPTVNALGNKSINIMPTYFYLFDSTDARRDVTCCPYNVAANGTTKLGQGIAAICDGKYRRDWVTNPVISPTSAVQYLGLKWQILRYSDILLMYAEAENEINGPVGAYNAVNMVRRRGYDKPIGVVDPTVDLAPGLSKAEMFKAIVRERSLEFGGEGIRKYDLIRWNLLATAIAETKANLAKMGTFTPIVDASYMLPYPSYSKSVLLPNNMFFYTNSAADNVALWNNSFYKYAAFQDPLGVYVTQTGNYTLLNTDDNTTVKGQTNIVTLPSAVGNTGRTFWVRFMPNNPAATTTADWTYSMKVNSVSSQTIDGGTGTYTYSGTVAKATPAAQNGPTRLVGFYSNGSNWITVTTAAWMGTTITASGTTSPLGRFATNFVTGKSELLPIPQPVRDANVNFTQNPGY
ncbi:MAG TPA: RagB/SusD family nutrient uptake outer membrane protein [Chitinophagaceae bacterium]|nr:RagB/SusD family nutrient uptake outer membrane protein [Chitinophagaceae bacterium]